MLLFNRIHFSCQWFIVSAHYCYILPFGVSKPELYFIYQISVNNILIFDPTYYLNPSKITYFSVMIFLSKQANGLVIVSPYRSRTIDITVTYLKPNETEIAGNQRGFASNAKRTEVSERNRMIMP